MCSFPTSLNFLSQIHRFESMDDRKEVCSLSHAHYFSFVFFKSHSFFDRVLISYLIRNKISCDLKGFSSDFFSCFNR